MTEFSESDLQVIAEYEKRKDAVSTPEKFRSWMANSNLNDFKFEPAAHHLRMQEEFQWWADTPGAKLALFLPFGSGKSVYSSIQLPLWLWARDPTLTILCASNTQSFAESMARRRRDAVDTNEFYQLTSAKLRGDAKGVTEFLNTKGGMMRATGVSASVTGFRSSANILDDPHIDFQQLESRKYRDEVFEWYTGIFRSRLSPGGKELICTTRFNADDLAGRLLRTEGDDWRVLRIGEVADSPDDELGREIGERLWPQYLDADRLLVRERNPRLWLAAYQSIPPAESGAWLSHQELTIVEVRPKGLKIYLAMDLALSVGKGDFSVIITAGTNDQGDLYILDVWREQVAVDDVAKNLMAICQATIPELVLIDDDNASKVFKNYALDAFRRGGVYAPLLELKTGGQDKEVRAAAFRGFARQGRVKILRAHWNADLMMEVEGFPDTCRNDDQVDSLSLLGRYMARMSLGKVEKLERSKPIQSGITQGANGQMYTTSTLAELWDDNRPLQLGRRRL